MCLRRLVEHPATSRRDHRRSHSSRRRTGFSLRDPKRRLSIFLKDPPDGLPDRSFDKCIQVDEAPTEVFRNATTDGALASSWQPNQHNVLRRRAGHDALLSIGVSLSEIPHVAVAVPQQFTERVSTELLQDCVCEHKCSHRFSDHTHGGHSRHITSLDG